MVLQYVLNIVYRLVSILHGGPKVLRHNLLSQPAKLALTTKLTLSRQNFTIGLTGKCLFVAEVKPNFVCTKRTVATPP